MIDPQIIRQILLALKLEAVRYKGWCLGLFITISSLFLVVGFSWPQTYQTSATLHADQTNIIEPLLRGRAEVTNIDGARSAKEIIYTRSFLEEVIKAANLADANAKPKVIEAKVKYLRQSLSIKSIGREYFKITHSSGEQDHTFNILTAVVKTFIDYTTKQKKAESYSAYKFIDSQVQAYKKQLEDAEDSLKEFKSKNVDGSAQSVTARITNLRTEIEALNLQKEEMVSKTATIKKQLSQESSFLHARARLGTLEERKSEIYSNLEQLRFTYQENYPDIVALKEQLEDVESQIQNIYEAEGIVGRQSNNSENPLYEELRIQMSSAEVQLKTITKRISSLNRLLEAEMKRAEKVAANEAQLSELTRDYDVTRNVYEEMLERKESARLSMVLDIEGQGITYRVHEPAVYPISAVGLRFKHFAIAGPILGFIFPIMVLIAYIILDPRVRDATRFKGGIGNIPLLATIPYFYTSISTRILRRDALVLVGVFLFFCICYVAIVANQVFELYSFG